MELHFVEYKSPDKIPGDFFLKLSDLDKSDFPTPWTLESFNDFIATHDFYLLALCDCEKLIGFVLFDIQFLDSFGHLLKIVVAEKFRGNKFGHKILHRAIENLEKLMVKHYFLEVEETNTNAILLYESLGFKQIHLNKNFYGKNRHALIMTMNIT